MDDSESQSERSQPDPVVVAAADLGSNSFHLVVAEVRGGQLVFVDRRKEFVRLAAGLDERKRLTPEASARALDCLDRFGERVRGLPLGTVRVVGTNTLRLARNANDLLEAAQRSLGHPVEIISGLEEARLIYLGVSRSLAGDERRLAVDIGGGSTELIIGEGSQPLDLESLYMGCVSSSLRHFPNGRVAEKRWRRAETAALVELAPVERRFRAGAGWESAVGSSGTVHSVATVVQAAGWCEEGITLEALLRLRELLIERGTTMNGGIKGLSEGRAPVFAGGVAVLLATFKALGHRAHAGRRRRPARGRALRSPRPAAPRGHAARRGRVDGPALPRAAGTGRAGPGDGASAPRSSAPKQWNLIGELPWLMLSWGAQLHEVGLDINHAGFHKHGAYIVENAEMHGFSLQEHLAAGLAGPLPPPQVPPPGLRPPALRPGARPARRLAVLLRLAVVLHRSRRTEPLAVRLDVDGRVSAAGAAQGLARDVAADPGRPAPGGEAPGRGEVPADGGGGGLKGGGRRLSRLVLAALLTRGWVESKMASRIR